METNFNASPSYFLTKKSENKTNADKIEVKIPEKFKKNI
jgi:hypothetical protein